MENKNKITNYLLADCGDVFTLHQPEPKKKGRTKILGPKEDATLDLLMRTGFADAAKINKTYQELLTNLGINDLYNDELLDELLNNLDNIGEEKEEYERPGRYWLDNNIIDEWTKVTILKLRLHHKWSVNSIWAKFWITKEQLNTLFGELK